MISIAGNKTEKGKQTFPVRKISTGYRIAETDAVIKETPLEISIAYGSPENRRKEILSVTMRTPGDDFNLVTGFLFAEHIIQRASDIVSMRFTGNDKEVLNESSLLIELSPELKINLSERKNFVTNSACGFCGRSAFDASQNEGVSFSLTTQEKISAQTFYSLPALLQSSQGLFAETGGSHAVALLTFDGELEKIFEDVGRHNAMDKLVGLMLKKNSIPLANRIVLFSGRLSYELVQKSLAAGIPVICSIGAPTSLALELAADHNMTVIGFLKKDRMNIYCGEERIQPD